MSRKRAALWSKPSFSQHDVSTTSNKKESPPLKLARSFSCTATENDITIDLTTPEKEIPHTFSVKSKNECSTNWIDSFSPQTLDDLAVHPKKIEEIQNWFKHCEVLKKRNQGGQVALITGPTGSGKTSTVKVIAKQLNYEIVEWITPVDLEYSNSLNAENTMVFKESQVEAFKRFLFQSSRYKSVFENSRRIILVEDFPNALIKESEGFCEILEKYRKSGKFPLIFIVADSKSRQLNISYNLFPDHVKGQFQITHISLNAVASTLLKKALKRICSLMSQESYIKNYKILSQDIVDSISFTAEGDIRNAVINLHFASLKGAKNLQMVISKKDSSKSKSKVKNKKLSSVGCDEQITMMHALGRVFYPKYNEGSNAKYLVHSPEVLTDQFSSQPKHFVDFIFANYASHFSTIENVLSAVDTLSISDTLMTEYREDQLGIEGLNLAIRGVMVSNSKPVSAFMSIRGLKKLNKDDSHITELQTFGLAKNITKNLLATDIRTYAKIIKS